MIVKLPAALAGPTRRLVMPNSLDLQERVWQLVDNSIDGYSDLIQMCLDRLDNEQLQELVESLAAGDEDDDD
jgi:DNA-binding MurR/RpiR family transcriptional regulator